MLPVRFIKPTSALLNWDPLRELDQFVHFLGGSTGQPCSSTEVSLQVDVREEDGCYVIEADLPGLGKDAVEITFEDGLLTITGQVDTDERREDENFHIRERHLGKVSRSFRLPDDVDAENIQAAMAEGVLTVTLQKVPTTQPREITVNGN